MPAAPPDLSEFVVANTKLLRPPLVPEIQLHLAEESLPLWQKTEEELGELGVPPPFWAFAWAGGQALARYILDTPDIVSGKTVLDIGTGSGLTAIAAKLAGAASVTANDVDELAVAASHLNAAANRVDIEITGDNLIAGRAGVASPDVLFLADVFYERELSDQVMTFSRKALSDGAKVLIGDPNRSYFPAGDFTKIAEYAVPVTRELEDSEIKRAAVWELIP